MPISQNHLQNGRYGHTQGTQGVSESRAVMVRHGQSANHEQSGSHSVGLREICFPSQ